jgi:hypothetical protein
VDIQFTNSSREFLTDAAEQGQFRLFPNLAANRVFLLVQGALFLLCDMAAILRRHRTFFLTNLTIILVQRSSLLLGHLTFLDLVSDPLILIGQTIIDLVAAWVSFGKVTVVFCSLGRNG